MTAKIYRGSEKGHLIARVGLFLLPGAAGKSKRNRTTQFAGRTGGCDLATSAGRPTRSHAAAMRHDRAANPPQISTVKIGNLLFMWRF